MGRSAPIWETPANVGFVMTALRKPSAWGSLAPLRQKLLSLGVESEAELNAILGSVRLGSRVIRGEDISTAGSSPRDWAVLIDGVACLYDRLIDGSRQIYSFQYPGDFCDPSRHVLQSSTGGVSVAAVTDCSIGFIEKLALEKLIAQHPALALALWRSMVLDAGALRARLLGSRQTALQRVAHLICEQLVRLQAVGIDDALVPVSQIDLADAAALSVVHVNRTFREMQAMGLLAKAGRSMKVVDMERLTRLANFNGSYLNLPQRQSRWEIEL